MPDSSKRASADSPTFGMSAVISSGPSLVSRATQVSSSMWMVVKRSSWTTRSEIRMESSKLYPFQGMKATSMFWPSASSPRSVEGPSASTSPAGDDITGLHQGPLVDASILIGAGVFGEVVDVDTRLARLVSPHR